MTSNPDWPDEWVKIHRVRHAMHAALDRSLDVPACVAKTLVAIERRAQALLGIGSP